MLTTDDVTVVSIKAGSTSITSRIAWTWEAIAAGVSPDAFITTAQLTPSALFAASALLASFTVTVTNIMSSGSARLTGPSLRTTLEGAPDLRNYSFTLIASKGARSTRRSARAGIRAGGPPVPSIDALLVKPNANELLQLRAVVAAEVPEDVALLWASVGSAEMGYAELALDASTLDCAGVTQDFLVLQPGALRAGA
eukprot:gene27293-33613_t